VNKKKKSFLVAPLAPTAPEKPSHSATDTISKDATWTEVVERKAKRLAGAEAAATNSSEFPALPSQKVVPRRLPPLRNAALIVRVRSGSSYEETVAKLQQSGVNPDASMRYAKANNVKVSDYDDTKPDSWLVYQDCKYTFFFLKAIFFFCFSKIYFFFR